MRTVVALTLVVGLYAGWGAVAPAARAADEPQPAGTPEQEEFEGLPEGLGREAVYFNCTACHSIKQVDQQRMTREDWDKLLDVMVGNNGMHPLQPWARTRVLNYLATHFGPEEEEDWGGLPPGGGREQVFYSCQACHSLAIVTQQGLSREFWDETLTWMVEEQAMPELDEEDRTMVLNYLATNFGPDSRQR
jgi:cytochrome c